MGISRLTTGLAGAALVVAMQAVCAAELLAADLPLKAPAAIPPSGNLFWAEVDLLAWSVKGDRLPPLVTTSPAGTPFAQAGVLGLSTTSVLFGDSSVNGAWRP